MRDYLTCGTTAQTIVGPIVTYENHIIDGHHRWSGLAFINSDCKINAYEIGGMNAHLATWAMKSVQLEIASVNGVIATKAVTKPNLLVMTQSAFKTYVDAKIAVKTVEYLKTFDAALSDKAKCVAWLWLKLDKLQKQYRAKHLATAGVRTFMPQPSSNFKQMVDAGKMPDASQA
jgi:hypothetical protein